MKNAALKAVVMFGFAASSIAVMSPTVFAGTATSNMSVTASVGASCTISTAALALGAYDPISTNASTAKDGTGTVTINCTQGSVVTIGLGDGLNAVSGQRKLASGAERLNYDIYSDSGRSTAWNTTTLVTTTGTGAAASHTAYGRIPAGQTTANAGTYTDTVVATVTF